VNGHLCLRGACRTMGYLAKSKAIGAGHASADSTKRKKGT
jgi:hypothetical protein